MTELEAQRGVSKYDRKFCKIATAMCKLGAIDTELAAAFDVSLSTINHWKVRHAEFKASVKVGKDVADERVEESLYKRAIGYSFDSEKILTSNGRVFREAIIEHIPPDVTAQVYWLKNRKEEWRVALMPAPVNEPNLIEQIRADAPKLVADEPGPENPIL